MLISIIIPNYNHSHYLPDNFNGLLAQSYSNWEAIIVDDCSTDNSKQVIQSFADKDARFKPIFLEKNKGSIPASNVGFDVMSGDLCIGSGADDYICNPGFFQKTIELINQYPSVAGVAFQSAVVDAETNEYCWTMGPGNSGYLDGQTAVISFFQRQLFIPGSSVIWKTKLVKQFGYQPDLSAQSDYFLNHALPLYGGVCVMSEIAAVYRKSPNTLSAKESYDAYFRQHGLLEKRLVELCQDFEISDDLRHYWRNSVIDEKLAWYKLNRSEEEYSIMKENALSLFDVTSI